MDVPVWIPAAIVPSLGSIHDSDVSIMIKRMGTIEPLPFDQYEALTELLWQSFGDDPYLRYLLGQHDRTIRDLLALRLRVQAQTQQPILVLRNFQGQIQGAALYAEPKDEVSLSVFLRYMVQFLLQGRWRLVWRLSDSFRRIEAVRRQSPSHYYLTLLVVIPEAQGQGYGTQLIEAIHRLSEADGRSQGVWLETDVTDNLGWYERFGYQQLEGIPIADLQMIALFRPNP
ncbi:MAG: GNAT family N-acetyltransferase [Spirulina sp. SIO3F2]|nr:GNAT family N-acetyltransferase [Spirulina sp. SIO3F2]